LAIDAGQVALEVTPDLKNFGKDLEKGVNKQGGRFSGVGKKIGLAMAVGVAAGIGGATALGAIGIKFNAEMQQVEVGLTTMLGSADKAKQTIGDLQKFAASTPFEFPELAKATQKLVAFGFAQEDLIPNMTMLGDIASGLGIPIGELSELYGKAKVQGRLYMEDINQLTGRGIPIIGAFAEQFGVAESEVRGLVEEGKIGFPDLEKAMGGMTSEGGMFSGMMEKQSKTFSGLMSTIKDNVQMALGNITLPLFTALSEKVLPKVVEKLGEMSAWVTAHMPEIERITAQAFSGIGSAIGFLTNDLLPGLVSVFKFVKDNISLVIPVVGALVAAFATFKIAGLITSFAGLATKVAGFVSAAGGIGPAITMALGPVGLIVIGVAALAAGMIYAYRESETFRAIVQDVWVKVQEAVGYAWTEIIKPAFEALSGFVTGTLGPIFSDFMTLLIETVWPAVSGAVKWAWENVIKPAFEAIRDFVTDPLTPLFNSFMGLLVDTVWPAISGAVSTAWGVIEPLWQAVKTFIDTILVPGFEDVQSVTETVWSAVETAIGDAWVLIEPIVQDLADFMADPVGKALGTLQTAAEDVWEAVSKAVSDAWGTEDTGIQGMLLDISAALSPVGDAFGALRTAAEKAWGGVTSAAIGALKILSSPIASFLNVLADIAEKVGAGNLGTALRSAAGKVSGWGELSEGSMGERLARNRGGWIPGGGPDRDSVPAMLTPGEFVINRKAVKNIPARVLAKLNDPSTPWGDAGRFNAGGFVKSPDEVLDEGRRVQSLGHYLMGGFTPYGIDCSGFMAWLSNFAAKGRGSAGGRWATGMAGGATLGRFARGQGDPATGFSIGVKKGSPGHTAGTIAGKNVESSGSRGPHVGGSRGWNYGPMRYHLPGFGGPSEEMKGWFGEIKGILGMFTGGDGFAGMFSALAKTIAEQAADFLADQIPFGGILKKIGGLMGLAGGGTVTSGGLLQVGENGRELVNLPRRATVSPVDPLTDAIEGLSGGLSDGDQLALMVDGEEITGVIMRRSGLAGFQQTVRAYG